MNEYEQLANAIILQAVKDYRQERKKKDSAKLIPLATFFRSKWFAVLTKVDGRLLEQKLREECR